MKNTWINGNDWFQINNGADITSKTTFNDSLIYSTGNSLRLEFSRWLLQSSGIAKMLVTLNDKDCWNKNKVEEPLGHSRSRQWETFSIINHDHCTCKRIENRHLRCIFISIHAVSTSVQYVAIHGLLPIPINNSILNCSHIWNSTLVCFYLTINVLLW